MNALSEVIGRTTERGVFSGWWGPTLFGLLFLILVVAAVLYFWKGIDPEMKSLLVLVCRIAVFAWAVLLILWLLSRVFGVWEF